MKSSVNFDLGNCANLTKIPTNCNCNSLTQLCYRNYYNTKLTFCALLLLLIFFIQDATNLKGMKVMIKDLDDVLFRDVGGKIAADGRCD